MGGGVGRSDGLQIYVVDVGAGQVGFYGVMKERNRPLIVALRLKVVNGQITEIEHVLARNLRESAVKALAETRAPNSSHRCRRPIACRVSRW